MTTRDRTGEAVDGRTLPPAPMPAALAALTDPAKAGPGPHDTPAELAARIAKLGRSHG